MKLLKVLAEKEYKDKLFTINENATIRELAEELCRLKIGAMLVVEKGSDPPNYIGIVSERDIILQCCLSDNPAEGKISDIMTTEMIVAEADDDVEYVMGVMTSRHIRHIPVVEEGRIIGMVSIGDIIKSLHEEKAITIRHLSDFASGMRKSNVF